MADSIPRPWARRDPALCRPSREGSALSDGLVDRSGKPPGTGSSGYCAAGSPGREGGGAAQRRIVLTAAVTVMAARMHLASWFGTEPWLAFAASMDVLEHRDAGLVELQSVFAAAAGAPGSARAPRTDVCFVHPAFEPANEKRDQTETRASVI